MPNFFVGQHKRAGVEPWESHLWEFHISTPPYQPISQYGFQSGGGAMDVKQFVWRCTNVNIPGFSVNVNRIDFKHTFVNYAGRDATQKAGSASCTFWDGQDLGIWKTLYAWQEYCKTNNKYGEGSYTVPSATFKILARNNATIAEIDLVDVFPSGVPAVPLAYNSDAPITLSVSWNFDDINVNILGPRAGGVPVEAS